MSEHIALRFDWDDVAHSRVLDIIGLNARTMNDGSLSWDAVAIRIDTKAVMLAVEPDTDQIIVSLEPIPGGDGWEPIPSLGFANGQLLGWCWIGINSQGYKDSFTLAFGDFVPHALEPRCTFLAEGSSLSCFDLTPHRV